MDWLKDYRTIIHGEAPRLQAVGLSFLGEDDTSMKFMDHDVAFTFTVEPFSRDLSVLVKFLSDTQPDDEIYALHMIMSLALGRNLTGTFQVNSAADRSRIVKVYVDFIVQQKQALFGPVFPLAQQYRQAKQSAASRIEAMFAANAPGASRP